MKKKKIIKKDGWGQPLPPRGNPTARYLDSNEAMQIMEEAGFFVPTKATMIRYFEKYKLGRKIGGRWAISKPRLIRFLKDIEEIDKELGE